MQILGMDFARCDPQAEKLRMDNLRTFLVAGDCGRFETEFLPQGRSATENKAFPQVADSVLPLPGREDVEAVGIALGLCRALSAAA